MIQESLSKRESQAMELIYRLGKATALEVQQLMPDNPNYSATRSLLTVLVEKGHLKFTREQRRYVYEPTKPLGRARKQALTRFLKTFFEGSPRNLMAALLDPKERKLTAAEVQELQQLLTQHQRSKES
jgi:BlaI family transcriptional regulator, penicillinase repressor